MVDAAAGNHCHVPARVVPIGVPGGTPKPHVGHFREGRASDG